MRYFKLLPLSLMMLGHATILHAEQVNLPAMSVEGVSAENIPYRLPPSSVSTNDSGDLMKRLPGANINRNGPLTSIAQYRGLFSDRVNVLIDGVRISAAGPNRMDSPLSYLPSSRIANVSVFRGIAPVSSGIETIGGTMTAESKKVDFGSNQAFEFHRNVASGYATNGHTRYAGITASAVNERHRFQLAGTVDRGNTLQFSEGDIRPSQHERETVGLSYGFQRLGHTLNIDIEHHDTGETGTPALPMDIVYARGESYTINFGKPLNNGGTLSARINYQDADHLMSNYRLRSAPMSQRDTLADVETKGMHLSYAQQHQTVGIDFDQSNHNADITDPSNAMFYVNNFNGVERDRYSIFSEWQHAIQPDLTVQSGIRFSRVETDADEVNTSMTMIGGMIGANTTVLRDHFNNADLSQADNLVDLNLVITKTINTNLDIEFGVARKQRAPSYQERYLWLPMQATSGLADGNNHTGNINLDAETAYQFELGFDWHIAQSGFSPRVFYHHINDYIQGTAATDATIIAVSSMPGMGGDTTPLLYNNVDAKLYGFDANWYTSLSPEWQLDGTISYVRGERHDTHDNLYRIAPLTARTILSYVRTQWRIGFEAETVAAQNKVSAENNEQHTNGYALFNILGSYQPTSQIALSAGINNLFDRSYQNHLGGYNRITDNPNVAQGDRLPGLGRSAYIGMTIDW